MTVKCRTWRRENKSVTLFSFLFYYRSKNKCHTLFFVWKKCDTLGSRTVICNEIKYKNKTGVVFIIWSLYWGLFSTSTGRDRVRISSFLYFDHFPFFDRSTSTFLLRTLYFDFFTNLDFLLVDKHRLKYSFGRSKV